MWRKVLLEDTSDICVCFPGRRCHEKKPLRVKTKGELLKSQRRIKITVGAGGDQSASGKLEKKNPKQTQNHLKVEDDRSVWKTMWLR